ncbi:thioesterase domain-containing protein, partial [Streptomyces sp. NPDC055078]
LQDKGIDVAELLLIGTPDPDPDPAGARPPETTAESVAAVGNTFAAVWGAPEPVRAADLVVGGIEEQSATAAERLLPHAPLRGRDLRRRLLTAARWRAALARAASAGPPRPLTGAGAVTVVRAVSRGQEPPGAFDRWIAPPPTLIDIDIDIDTDTDDVAIDSTGTGGDTGSGTGTGGDDGRTRLASARAAQEILRHLRAAGRSTPSTRSAALVPINRHGDGQRSFWAHNLYGEVSYAVYLSRHFGPRTPVLGLEQVDMDSRVTLYDSVEEMAARYVGELRDQFTGEPFTLGGASFGGVLAYEMARQLQHEGETVSQLLAVDPIMPGTGAWNGVDWGAVTEMEAEAFSVVMLGNSCCQRYGVTEQIPLARLSGLDLDGQLEHVVGHVVAQAPSRPDPKALRHHIRLRHELMLHNSRLLGEYRPRPLRAPVPTVMFRATEGFVAPVNDNDLPPVARTDDDPSNGFAEFVGDELVVHELKADHHTIAYNHNLARIADLLLPFLERPVR